MKKILFFSSIGFVCSIFIFVLISRAFYYSNVPQSCISCHEMQVFYESWKLSAHGIKEKGVFKARCVDCHLPHDSFFNYVTYKIKAGVNDWWAHILRKKDTPDKWLSYLVEKELKGSKKTVAFDSGCKRCHKELIGHGIPLKAIKAHKEYLLGETEKNCVSCHKEVGHGDIITFITKLRKKTKNKKGG